MEKNVKDLLQNVIFDLSICLSEIPREKMSKAKNGKIYVNLTAAMRREPDEWKRDLKVYVTQTKDDKEKHVAKVYVGAGKTVIFEEQQPTPPSESDIDSLLNPTDDCAF